jgi:hypothetical protein
MNCLLSLERWYRGFESHSRNGFLCVCFFRVCVVLCVGRKPYRLCKNDYETEEARDQQGAVEPLMNE